MNLVVLLRFGDSSLCGFKRKLGGGGAGLTLPQRSNGGDNTFVSLTGPVAMNGAICSSEENELPLVGDYVGMGGPDAVPLETQGAFEKPLAPLHKHPVYSILSFLHTK